MATLEQVEKLREKANVSYEEARAALDAAGGELLDALIYLEQQGKVSSPDGGGYYSSENQPEQGPAAGDYRKDRQYHCGGGSFGDVMRKIGRILAKALQIGNTNYLVAVKNGGEILSCPVTALVLLLIIAFWAVVPLFIVSLFFGFRYHFSGSELGTENVNNAMNGASDAVDDIKKNFGGEKQQ